MCPIFMKFGTRNKLLIINTNYQLIINILIGIDDLDPNYKFAKFGPKTEMCFNFHEIWRQSKWKMLIMNIVPGIDYLDPKL